MTPSDGSCVQVGYLCIQGYPRRICIGCTSGCREPVYVEASDDEEESHAKDC